MDSLEVFQTFLQMLEVTSQVNIGVNSDLDTCEFTPASPISYKSLTTTIKISLL